MEYKLSQVQKVLILEVATVQFMSIFSHFGALFCQKTLDSVTMATDVKIKELSMNDFVLGGNNQVQKVSLKSETMREQLCFIFTENCS